MGKSVLYAYLKTIDGEEVMEYTEKEFAEAKEKLNLREVRKHDRTLYFVEDNNHVGTMRFYKDDYIEVVD